ncbi:MAG: tetratricopeptide repeat protein [Candidatus Poribacteria bacterium]|nr:tetratricopeptide repeat protein [Candidatus Poribacteria bacterium]
MHWPNRTEYTQAVRDYPHISIKDPKLKEGKPQFAKDGFLNSFNGGFSIVFPFDMTSQTYALRCWTQEVGNAEFRYKEISTYLKQVGLPYFVDFEYVPNGILVNGAKYPVTRMEWAKGKTLRDFIEQNIQDAHIFKNVASEFQKMVASLHKHQIAHGDLQDGNILLKRNGTDINIKLIDYDSLYVPTLKGQPDQIIGLKEYQHPKRMLGGGYVNDANEKVDYFSELVIFLSFLSLAEMPSLWSQFGNEKRVNNGLLFSKEDFENPNQSDIFKELENLSPEIQQLAATLKDYCTKTSLDQLQPLEAILPKPDANTHTNHGFSLLNDKRYDEALTEFQKAIVINPNYKKAGYGIGLAHLHSQRYTEAISAFGQAIGKDPNYKEAYYGLGLAHFKSGDNSKAMIAVNEALKIDPHYQLAKQLLSTINPASDPPPPDPPSDFWRSILEEITNHWQHVATGFLAVGLVIFLIAFLTQMNAKEKALAQNTGLKNQITQKEKQIQGLNTSIQTLKSNNESLNTKNKTLQEELKSRTLQEELKSKALSDEKTTQNVVSLQRQLNEQKDENRQLQNQLTKKNIEIRKLQTDESDALNQKSGLESQLGQKNLQINRLNTKLKNIQKENSELQREKFKLQTENKTLTRLKESLNTDIVSLRRQLNDNKQNVSNNGVETNRPNIRPQENLVVLEPPTENDAY